MGVNSPSLRGLIGTPLKVQVFVKFPSRLDMSTDDFRVIWSFVGYDDASQNQDKVWVAQKCTISLDVCGGSTLFFF